MEPSIVNALPNLGVGVAAVVAIYYVSKAFIAAAERRDAKHMEALTERENALRAVEKEVRTSITSQLAENTAIMRDVVRVLEIKR